jgi:hypothetical protein
MPVKRRDAGSWLAPSKQASPVHVPRGQIGPGAVPMILVLDAQGLARGHRRGGVTPLPRLNAGLLVRRDHIVARPQRSALPATLIEIQNRPGPLGKPRVARKEPAAMAPRPNRVRVQPAPQRRAADRRDESPRQDFAAEIGQRPARDRHARVHRALARDLLHLNDDVGGKSGLVARPAAPPRGPRAVGQRNDGATC